LKVYAKIRIEGISATFVRGIEEIEGIDEIEGIICDLEKVKTINETE
jgi:hypothetical protein